MGNAESEIKAIVDAQRDYFRKGETLSVKWRIAQLKKLKTAVIESEAEIEKALACRC